MFWKNLLQNISISCISWPPLSGCKINIDNIFQLKIALDCFVSLMWSYFVCCHLFCACACVSTYIYCTSYSYKARFEIITCLVAQNFWMMDVFVKSSPNCRANQDPWLTLHNSQLKFFLNTVKILKLFIMVTILSRVHWLYSMKQRQWGSSPQSVMAKHWITIGSFQKVIIS